MTATSFATEGPRRVAVRVRVVASHAFFWKGKWPVVDPGRRGAVLREFRDGLREHRRSQGGAPDSWDVGQFSVAQRASSGGRRDVLIWRNTATGPTGAASAFAGYVRRECRRFCCDVVRSEERAVYYDHGIGAVEYVLDVDVYDFSRLGALAATLRAAVDIVRLDPRSPMGGSWQDDLHAVFGDLGAHDGELGYRAWPAVATAPGSATPRLRSRERDAIKARLNRRASLSRAVSFGIVLREATTDRSVDLTDSELRGTLADFTGRADDGIVPLPRAEGMVATGYDGHAAFVSAGEAADAVEDVVVGMWRLALMYWAGVHRSVAEIHAFLAASSRGVPPSRRVEEGDELHRLAAVLSSESLPANLAQFALDERVYDACWKSWRMAELSLAAEQALKALDDALQRDADKAAEGREAEKEADAKSAERRAGAILACVTVLTVVSVTADFFSLREKHPAAAIAGVAVAIILGAAFYSLLYWKDRLRRIFKASKDLSRRARDRIVVRLRRSR
ncbi:MAG TPA: hypothetical protein VEI02_15650 [Planctomycetota bacterium]|nr:hypothetical protein [Planctomycetota bacterium]